MNRRNLVVWFLAASRLVVNAQGITGTDKPAASHVSNHSLAAAYEDSLRIIRNRPVSCPNVCHTEDKARLFLPLTFYRDEVHRAFSLDADGGNKALWNIYLNRPSLVETTGEQLKRLRRASVDIDRPIHHDVDIVEKTEPVAAGAESVPVEVFVKKPDFWFYRGEYSLQMLQNYVSGNWHKGGESNYSAIASVMMEANYNNKQRMKWENRLEMKFGMQSSRSDSLHSYKTTEDLLRLTSKLGLQADKRWYYTLQLVAHSQFTHSYRSNDPKIYADFLAPLNVNVSVGMDYSVDWLEHRLKGTFHLAPLAYNMKYTRLVELSERLGIDGGRHFRHDYGSELTIDLEWKLMDMLKWKTRLYGYTSYKRTELEWENTFTLAFSRYVGARLFLYPRFDDGVGRDSHHGYWQFKELASVGFQYSF